MLERVITELTKKRDEFALDSLRKPRTDNDPSYELGRICGVIEGFDKAISTVTEVLKDLIDEDT